MDSPFKIRAVVEAFYGAFYTAPERIDLVRFAGQHGYNLYLYGPKNDRQHRHRWREPYPPFILDEFASTVAAAREVGVTFCYAISPIAVDFAGEDDEALILAKLRSFYNLGIRSFSIFFDDIIPELRSEAERRRYRCFAQAHADLSNRIFARLQELDPACTLSMCPTDYSGSAPFSAYLRELGEELDPAIDIFYTGPDIYSPAITTADAQTFAATVHRCSIIWDNYPVNDLSKRPEMHIGPIRGRQDTLYQAVKGIAVNAMLQAEASKIPLLTYADYLADPYGYDPARSWDKALREVAGEDSFDALRLFAENSLRSFLEYEQREQLEVLSKKALVALKSGESVVTSPALRALAEYLTRMDDAGYHLKFRMRNLRLRQDLLPWIEQLEFCQQSASWALRVLEAIERREPYAHPLRMMREFLREASTHPKRTTGIVLLPLAEYVQDCVTRPGRVLQTA